MKNRLLPVLVAAMMAGTTAKAQISVFAKNSNWSYNDANQALPDQWKDTTFNITSWATGNGPLGYGDPVTTQINTGLITAYFAKDFNVNLSQLSNDMELGIMRDDGIIVYLNGVEIVRDNMPSGPVTFNTWSSTTIDGSNESLYCTSSKESVLFLRECFRFQI